MSDEQGADLGLLPLNTGTLTYPNLSDTEYSKNQNNGFSGSGGETLSLQLQNNSSYSKTKTLATLGQGNLDITDSESSSDLSQLNRDVENTSKYLFSVEREQGNADVTIDTRLLSKTGWASISEDIKRTELGIDSVSEMVKQDSVVLSDTFEHMDYLQKDLNVQIKVVRDAQKAAIDLNNLDSASAKDKLKAIEVYASAYADELGITIESARIIAVDRVVNGAAYRSGQRDISKIVLNDSSLNNSLEYMKALTHEVSHLAESQGVIGSKGDQSENYAKLIGQHGADNYAWAYEHAGLGEVKTGDVNTHIGNDSAEVKAASDAFLADEARLGPENIHYSLNREEMTKKIAALSACNSSGAGSEACTTVNELNILDATRDVELQKACQDLSSDACKTELAKAQDNYSSYDEDSDPFEDTKYGQERESIIVNLRDPDGSQRKQEEESLYDLMEDIGFVCSMVYMACSYIVGGTSAFINVLDGVKNNDEYSIGKGAFGTLSFLLIIP